MDVNRAICIKRPAYKKGKICNLERAPSIQAYRKDN